MRRLRKNQKTNGILKKALITCTVFLTATIGAKASVLGVPWTDTEGRFISAHEGGISHFGNTYYWYGTSYRGNPKGLYGREGRKFANGFNVYSSMDLIQWKWDGVCLTVPSTGWASQGTLHRPNVLYNGKTKKYVMWSFYYVSYPNVMLTVATADSPIGPFHILGQRESGEEHGWAQDLGTFQDDDGKAYIVYDDGHRNLRVDLLADDYLSSTKTSVIALQGPAYEGAAMIKWKGRYIVAGSGVVGWGASETDYAIAHAPLGPYGKQRRMSQQNTWGSQISNFFCDSTGQKVYALCDRWWRTTDDHETSDLEQSSYYFLPMNLDPKTDAATLAYPGTEAFGKAETNR